MTTTIGLAIIVVAWFYQLIMVLRKNYSLQRLFVIGYGLGVLFLVVDGYKTGFSMAASLNLICLVVVLFVSILSKKS